LHLLEETEVLDAVFRTLHPAAVERVAFHQAELAANNLIERTHIAIDVDALDVDLRPFLNVEDDIDGVLFAVTGDFRLDFDKSLPAIAHPTGQPGYRFLDPPGIVPVVRLHRQERQYRFLRQILQPDIHVELAKAIALTLLDRKCDNKSVAVRREFGDRRNHPE